MLLSQSFYYKKKKRIGAHTKKQNIGYRFSQLCDTVTDKSSYHSNATSLSLQVLFKCLL